MIEIRSVADSTGTVYYPQNHYQAVLEFDKGVKQVVDANYINNFIKPKYVKDLHSIVESGLFYFDEKTSNKPSQLNNGFVQTLFYDEKNGVVNLVNTLNFYEIQDSKWSELKTINSVLQGGDGNETK